MAHEARGRPEPGSEGSTADGIGRFLAARVEQGWMPGATWWVEHAGEVISRGAVGASVLWPHREAAIEDTAYDLASLTKPLATALLLAVLEQQGVIDLEAPVADYLEELAGTPRGRSSLADLASHAAGLPAWSPLYLEARTIEDFSLAIARTPRAVEPGRHLYSDLGYVLLGAVIERCSGQGLERLFEQRIAVPLGLRRTGFAPRGTLFPGAAASERGNEYERGMCGEGVRGFPQRREIPAGEVHDTNAFTLGGVSGHAGLFGTAKEAARIAREMLGSGPLGISAGARMRLLRRAGHRGRTIGFVVAMDSSAARGILPDESPGHTGFTGTSIWLELERGAIAVLLTNRVHPRVPLREFRWLRRGFHRMALAALEGKE